MSWNTIKKSIQNDLISRGLKNPNIRLNALERIERLLKVNFPKMIENPTTEFNMIDKKELKQKLSDFKESDKISGAENSIINEIYKRIK